MSNDHVASISDYLSGTQSVLYAGQRLRLALAQDAATVEYAVTRLERTAQQQSSDAAGYQAFMFSEAEVAPEGAKAIQTRVTEDVLASVLVDLDVANVLLAAGAARGETGEKADPKLLDEALLRLQNSTQSIEQSLASPLGADSVPGRFGFSEDKPPEEVKSADLPAAVKTAATRANDTLNGLVSEAKATANGAIQALSKLDDAKVLEALSKLGVQVQDLPKVGRLFRLGIEKLKGAINSLLRMLGPDTLKKVKDQAEKVWKEVKGGKYIEDMLQWAFGIDATQKRIKEVLALKTLQVEAVDKASNELPKLAIRFKETMGMLQSIVAATALAATVISVVFPAAAPEVALAVGAIYVLILAAIILFGIDYADSGLLLRRVRGVGEIVKGLQPA